MTSQELDVLRAYVDGELDEMAAARVARAADADPELAARISAERRLRDALGAHFAPIIDEAIPARLTAPIDAARKVVPLNAARMRRVGINKDTLRWAAPAIAAALILAIVLPREGGPTETRDGLTFAANDLAHALDRQLVANQGGGSETRVLLSFADKEGSLCRGFARADLSGIACKESGGWRLRLQRDGIDVGGSDYRQARSVDTAIMAAVQEMAAGPAFNADQERAAKARGWSR